MTNIRYTRNQVIVDGHPMSKEAFSAKVASGEIVADVVEQSDGVEPATLPDPVPTKKPKKKLGGKQVTSKSLAGKPIEAKTADLALEAAADADGGKVDPEAFTAAEFAASDAVAQAMADLDEATAEKDDDGA